MPSRPTTTAPGTPRQNRAEGPFPARGAPSAPAPIVPASPTRPTKAAKRRAAAAGRAGELAAEAAMLADGARYVIRAHCSKGEADLIALFDGWCLFAQVKCHSSKTFNPKGGDRAGLRRMAAALPSYCVVELWLQRIGEAAFTRERYFPDGRVEKVTP